MEKIDRTYKNLKSCIHTKNIFSLIDLEGDLDKAHFLNQHLKECTHCQKTYHIFKEKMFAANTFIPRPLMDRELRDTFDRELSALLKSLKINDSVVRKEILIEKLSAINLFAESFIKNMFSKNMFFTYGLAGGIYLLFKFHIFHH